MGSPGTCKLKLRSLVAGVLAAWQPLSAQVMDTICQQQEFVIRNLMAYHISGPVFEKEGNAAVLDEFIRLADERNIYLLSADRDYVLVQTRFMLPADAACRTVKLASAIVSRRAGQVDSILNRVEKA